MSINLKTKEMDLVEKIEDLESYIKMYSNLVEKAKNKVCKLRLCKQPSNEDFYKNIRDYVDIKISEKSYTFILGGDGRSEPWDEQRFGVVADATVKDGVYISVVQERILMDFIKNTEKVDHIEIISGI